MEQQPRTQPQATIVLLLMGMAIVFAAVGFLAWSVIQNRQADSTTSTTLNDQTVVTVGDQQIALRENPALLVEIISSPPVDQPPPAAEVVEEAPSEPATPEPQPTDTAVPEITAVPTITPIPQQEQPAASGADPVTFTEYTVQAKDTLYKLTTIYATSITLMAEYSIAQDHLIPGETIRIPIGNPAYCPGKRPYAVGEGETAFSISQRYNISKEELQSLNGLNDQFEIDAGQILCVP